MRTTHTEIPVLCDFWWFYRGITCVLKSQNAHICWRWHHITSSRWVALRFFQQKAKVDDCSEEHEGRLKASPSLKAPHFPNGCYSCSALTFHDGCCGSAVGGLVFILLQRWWRAASRQTVRIVCRFVPPAARCVFCEAAPVHHGFLTIWVRRGLGRNFSMGCSTLKKEVYEKEEIKA